MIEINKPTWQKTTIDNDYVAPASYDHEGGRHKIPTRNKRTGNWVSWQCTCLPLFAAIFPEVVILADELWDIIILYLFHG